jgi:hypothetical protein
LIPPFGGSIPPAPASTQCTEFITETALPPSVCRTCAKSVEAPWVMRYGLEREGVGAVISTSTQLSARDCLMVGM